MARTPFSAQVVVGAPYTVPAGKYAVFAAFNLGASTPEVRIAGVAIAAFKVPGSTGAVSIDRIAPLNAASGQVIATDSAAFGISGFLYDNPPS